MKLSQEMFKALGQAWLEGTKDLKHDSWSDPTLLLPGMQALVPVLVASGHLALSRDEHPVTTAAGFSTMLVYGCRLTPDGQQEKLFGSFWRLAQGLVLWVPSYQPRNAGLLESYPTPRGHSWTRSLNTLTPRNRGDCWLELRAEARIHPTQRWRLVEAGLTGGEIIYEHGDNALEVYVSQARWQEMTTRLDTWLA